MITKRIAAGLLALTMTFGGVAVSAEETYSQETTSIESLDISADESPVRLELAAYYGDFYYTVLDNGNIEITSYSGNDSNITIPSHINGRKVTNIGWEAFARCSSLKSVIIPNGVTSIDDEAFFECENLTNVTIPNSVTSIGKNAFHLCTSLKSISIPNNITSISDGTFWACSSLKSVTIPNSVKSIGSYAFSGTSLTSVTIPNSVTSIDYFAFSFCTSLTSITIPNSVKCINEGVFYFCTNLINVKIPNSVNFIGNYAFSDCTNLTSLKIPNSVVSIGDNAFSSCKSLTDITIPNSVVTICYSAFSDCTSITSVTISSNVEVIAGFAFDGCTSLKDVYYAGSKSQWSAISIYSGNGWLTGATIHYNYVAPHTHTYKATVVPPTYAAQGYTEHKCTICGDSYKDNYTAKKILPVVSVTTYSSTTNAVRINWNKVSGASGYRVYRYNTATKKWETAKTISGGSTVTYRESGLKAGTNYKYKVKAYVKENGKTYWSEASNTITTATKPATVKITKAGKTTTAVRLYWNKVDCTGYKLQQYNPSTKKWTTVKVLKSTDTNYRISGLKKNTAYKFRIQAYKTAGSQKVYGAWSATKTVTTKK